MSASIPANPDAEQAVLGALLLNREAIIAVAPWLAPEHFFLEKHAWIYAAILACYRQRVPPDIRTVAEELRRHHQLDAVGGIAYLSELTDAVPTSYHIAYYGRIVEAAAVRRRLLAAAGTIAHVAGDERLPLDEAIVHAQTALLAATRRTDADIVVPIGEPLGALYDAIDAGTPPGTPTGFGDLDAITGGLHAGDLVLLGGRPGTGKTSLALAIALACAERGQPVLLFSMEMSREQLAQRLVAMRAQVDLAALRRHHLGEDRLRIALSAMSALAELPIWIDDTPAPAIADLHARAQRFLAERDALGLVVVDYLQLVQAHLGRDATRVQEVGAVSRGLKALARELRCPVLALSQLSRAIEQRADKTPLLSDLRESGQQEQDADLVLFIHREELYDRDPSKRGRAELHIAKHRNGPLGVVPLIFDAATTRFCSVARGR